LGLLSILFNAKR